MLKHFKYTKENGDESNRVVYPLRLVDDKLLSIDVSDMTDAERQESIVVLDAIHKQYVKAVADAGFASRYRYFFVEQIS